MALYFGKRVGLDLMWARDNSVIKLTYNYSLCLRDPPKYLSDNPLSEHVLNEKGEKLSKSLEISQYLHHDKEPIPMNFGDHQPC